MNNLNFNIRFHNRDISAAELDRYQYERALHVLHELKYLGADIVHQGKPLSHIDINWLDPETAQAVLLDTKAALGEQGTLALLKDVLADSDRRWKEWAAEPIETQGVWISQCDLAVEGVGVEAMAKLFFMEDLRMGLMIMPEHYYFAGAVADGKQYILETFGLFGEPTYTVGTVLPELPPFLAAYRDESYPQQLIGNTALHSDGSRIHVGAFHQIKPTANGFAIRSVFYCPKNAPKAVADGHVIHFAIELREGIKRGAETLKNMQKPVCVTSQSVHGIADDERINEWELKAAKRALMNLRELLYGEPMMKLLAGQLEQAAKLHKDYLAQSEGKWAETEVVLTAKGVKATAIPKILAESFALAAGDEAARKNMCMTLGFPMHPEHYAVPVPMSVVETMGGIPTLTLVARDENPPEFVRQKLDSRYQIQFTGKGVLQDGTEHSFVLQQFKDTDEGLQASLRIWYPAACPAEYLEEHAEHYTIEFRNLFRTIAEKMQG